MLLPINVKSAHKRISTMILILMLVFLVMLVRSSIPLLDSALNAPLKTNSILLAMIPVLIVHSATNITTTIWLFVLLVTMLISSLTPYQMAVSVALTPTKSSMLSRMNAMSAHT